MIKIVAGLGNPGDKYRGTRHNIGFDVLDALGERFSLSWVKKFGGEFADYTVNGEKVFFIKPLTYMNLSGDCVAQTASFYKTAPQEVFVIHDEMNIPYGSIKIRKDGSAGGHNGLKSIIERLGSQDFPRLKMGIGKGADKDSVPHVLGKWRKEELDTYKEFIEKGLNAVLCVLSGGTDKAMNIYNQNNLNFDRL